MMTEDEAFEWNRICFAYADIVEQQNHMADYIERLEKYRDLVEFIASDYIELSYEKAQCQRDDWLKRCKKIIAEKK
jgi:hypothetical protein